MGVEVADGIALDGAAVLSVPVDSWVEIRVALAAAEVSVGVSTVVLEEGEIVCFEAEMQLVIIKSRTNIDNL